MKRMMLISVLALAGCTTTATREAIKNYEVVETRREEVVNNSLRIANEQVFLNLQQYIKAHPEKTAEAIEAAWKSRDVLEEIRAQYLIGTALSRLTVGQYLYDQQGWFNVLAEDQSASLKKTSDAAQAANKAVGITSVKDLLPTSQPASSPMSVLERLEQLKRLGEVIVPGK